MFGYRGAFKKEIKKKLSETAARAGFQHFAFPQKNIYYENEIWRKSEWWYSLLMDVQPTSDKEK